MTQQNQSRSRMYSAPRHDTVADVLERVLDTGVVIAGDIRVQLADVELLTIQIRLVICSVDKAQEMGMDWGKNASFLSGERRPDALKLVEGWGTVAVPVSPWFGRALETATELQIPVVLVGHGSGDRLQGQLSENSVHLDVASARSGGAAEIQFMLLNVLCQLIDRQLFGGYLQD